MSNDQLSNPTTDDETRSQPKRRTILGTIGAVTGVSALTGSPAGMAAAQEYNDPETVCTRRCSDSYATEDDWSTSALTVQACPTGNGGELRLQVTGQVGLDRFDAPDQNPAHGPEGGRGSDAQQDQSVTIHQEQAIESDGETEATQTQTIIIEQGQVMTGGSSSDTGETTAAEGSTDVEFPSVTVRVDPGEKRNIWYTGTIVGLHISNTDLNIAIANRPPY